MSEGIRTLGARSPADRSASLGAFWQATWKQGLLAAVTWAAAAVATIALPDVVPWGSAGLFAGITAAGAALFVVLALVAKRLGKVGERLVHFGPWFIAIGVWL